MPLPLMNVDGGAGVSARALTRVLVARMRLSRSACLRPAVQRPPAMDSPARLMTAVAPSSSRASSPACPSGLQPIRVMPGLPVPDSCWAWPAGRDRVSTRTSWLSSAHAQARGLPRNPVPPAMTTFMDWPRSFSARRVLCLTCQEPAKFASVSALQCQVCNPRWTDSKVKYATFRVCCHPSTVARGRRGSGKDPADSSERQDRGHAADPSDDRRWPGALRPVPPGATDGMESGQAPDPYHDFVLDESCGATTAPRRWSRTVSRPADVVSDRIAGFGKRGLRSAGRQHVHLP